MNTPVLVRREEFGVGRKQLEISNEELGIGDGVGFIMDFICGVVERYAGDFILQFLCVMSGIYWHLTRMGAHCAPANPRQHRIILSADTASEVRQLLGQKRR